MMKPFFALALAFLLLFGLMLSCSATGTDLPFTDDGQRTTVLSASVSASYLIRIPGDTTLKTDDAEPQYFGDVGVSSVSHADIVTCTPVGTDLTGESGTIPVSYGYKTADVLMPFGPFSCYKEGKSLDAAVYATVLQSDWDAASDGVYSARVTFRFEVGNKYRNADLWAFNEADEEADADVFFLAPTTSAMNAYGYTNMSLSDRATMEKHALQIRNQKGIYDNVGKELESDPEDASVNTRFFAPFISQAVMETFTGMTEEERLPYLKAAYEDVKEAFAYYLEHYNHGNGIILAGSSQGAQLCTWLVRDYFDGTELSQKLICCYAIGWKVTEAFIGALEDVHFASGATDIRSIVTFNSEAEGITESLIVGKNEKSLCINPLTWTTEPGKAGKAEKENNLGCCVYSTTKGKKSEIDEFCAAYIDETRGTLKIVDFDDDGSYKPFIDGQPYGVFHAWDWEFFYRNLEKNVSDRIHTYLTK